MTISGLKARPTDAPGFPKDEAGLSALFLPLDIVPGPLAQAGIKRAVGASAVDDLW